mgnify:CR=1 FL=1
MKKEFWFVTACLIGIATLSGCNWDALTGSSWEDTVYWENSGLNRIEPIPSQPTRAYTPEDCSKLALEKSDEVPGHADLLQPMDTAPVLFEKVEQDTPYKLRFTVKSMTTEGAPVYPRVDAVTFEWRSKEFTIQYGSDSQGKRFISSIAQDTWHYYYLCSKIEERTYECAISDSDKHSLQTRAGIFFLDEDLHRASHRGFFGALA